ncbi:type VI secretion system protein TssA [Rhodoferax sp.]|uniref:type VI secretion system protein TssA n=1 Tax=Rhodoferax sp. TaxID=50421 RepID=UPI002779C01B|nr:type VI secretion system protein TssA [Rhodoferax sp.]
MNTELLEHAQQHFAQRLHCSLADLLEPIDAQHPAGYCVKSSGVYHAIQSARREDDASLPQGPWQCELKRADWAAVSNTAADNLRRQSKDLQLAAWLLEAQLHQCGFAGLAPALVLMNELIRRFWQGLHPQEADGGCTHRANVLRWINKKLLPALKQVPLTDVVQGLNYGWAEREAAWRREQLKPAVGANEGETTLQAIHSAMAQSPATHHLALHTELRWSLQAVLCLTQTVDDCFGDDKPSLASLAGLLKQMLAVVEGELHRRGLLPSAPSLVGEVATAPAAPRLPTVAQAAPASPPSSADARAQAYALLEQAASTLLQTDPHSPTPYLVQRAVQWGRLSTAELYQEVFIRMGGQLNIFELLGLQVPSGEAATQ